LFWRVHGPTHFGCGNVWYFRHEPLDAEQAFNVNINNLIETETVDDVLVMRIQTEQIKDAIVAQDLKIIFGQTVKSSLATKFVLDMGKLTFMTSLGCVAFISVKHAIRDKQGRLILCNITPFIRKIFSAKRLLKQSQLNGNVAFECADSLEDALHMHAAKETEV